jgi:hypothetical protein
VTAVALGVAGLQLLDQGLSRGGPPTVRPAGTVPAAVRPAPRATPRPALGRSRPVRLDIPRIGVHTPLLRLGLRRDGTLAVPPLGAGAPAGWYEGFPSPGEVGPAILVGHVDSARDGPAVFFRLGELRPGDRIGVLRADGSRVSFTVTATASYAKAAFPTRRVYGPADRPVLRLVTCGGRFDRTSRHYLDNVVVYADLASAS